MNKGIGFLIVLLTMQYYSQAQTKNTMKWNNKQCAVVLTYDDALNVHLDNVIPILNANDFKGTFYVPGNAKTIDARMQDWRMAASFGHELGNHTIYHPCDGSLPGRSWVNKENDLSKYSLSQIINEIRLANTLLKAIDNNEERTFAYTCGDMQVNNVSFVDSIKQDFMAARGVNSAYNTMETIDLFNINCFMINGASAEEMITIVNNGIAEGALVVFLFHGVGGEHNIDVALEDHNKLIEYLKIKEDSIWVDNMLEVAKYIKSNK